jgi:uncharacterized membrane protein YgcG
VASGSASAGGISAGGTSAGDARTGGVQASTAAAAGAPDAGGPQGSQAAPHAAAGQGLAGTRTVDRAEAVMSRTPSPFTPRQLARLDEALTMSSRETGIDFSVYVGALDEPTREHAERLHTGLGEMAPNGVLLAVSPGQRVLHIVTGEHSSRRLPDRSCALAALSMEASFSGGDLVGGIVNGLRMLSDQVGHRASHRGGLR